MVDPISNFGRALIDEGIYEPQLTALIEAELKEGDVFIDIGASEGYFSILASRFVGKGRVISVEPQPRSQRALRENVSLNGCWNVEIWPCALSDRPGKLVLSTGPSSNPGSSGLYHHRLGAGTIEVPGETFDSKVRQLGLGTVRLMKIDAEGAELLILQGAKDSLDSGLVELIAVEVHDALGPDSDSRFDEIDSLLRQRNYCPIMDKAILLYERLGTSHAGSEEISQGPEA